MSLISLEKTKKSIVPLKVAVIGAGVMGRHHLRVYRNMSGVELKAVVDCNEKRAREAALQFDCDAYTNVEDIVGMVDAVSIAVPSSLHAEIGRFFLEKGIHCLVEKPLATTESDCLKLIEISEKNNLILLVGHIEQFNPAVLELKRILANCRLYAIDVERMNGNVKRINDVDVVLDLMIHDLDIVLSLMAHPVSHLSAEAISLSKNKSADYVSALLTFTNGVIANLKASKITQKKVRKISLTTDLGYIVLDYGLQEVLVYKQQNNALNQTSMKEGNITYGSEQTIERIAITPQEPLQLELENFVQSVQKGVPLGVDARQALVSLRLVWEIQKEIMSRQILPKKQRVSIVEALVN